MRPRATITPTGLTCAVRDTAWTRPIGTTSSDHLGDVTERLVLCAHTHIARVVRIGEQMIANPGSAGCPAYLDDRYSPPFIAQTGMGDARYAVFEQHGDDWITSLRTVPYDASGHDRPDPRPGCRKLGRGGGNRLDHSAGLIATR
jgi:hypothetical protein